MLELAPLHGDGLLLDRVAAAKEFLEMFGRFAGGLLELNEGILDLRLALLARAVESGEAVHHDLAEVLRGLELILALTNWRWK